MILHALVLLPLHALRFCTLKEIFTFIIESVWYGTVVPSMKTVSYESCRAVPCRAVPCRAVPCRAVPCRAVPCRAVPCRAVVSKNLAGAARCGTVRHGI